MGRRIKGLGAAVALTMTVPLVLGGGSAAPAAATITTTTATASACSRLASAVRLDAVDYADRLVRAWGRGDRSAAECYGTTATVRRLFGQATPGGIHWRRISAEGAAGTVYVTYHDDARGGNLTIGVSNVALSQGDAHAAYSARFRGEPRAWGPVAWSDNLVRAWGRGDKAWMSYYATPAVVQSLTHIAPSGGPAWRRVATEGAAGTIFVTYHNDVSGHQLIIGVSNVALSQGDAHAAYTIRFR